MSLVSVNGADVYVHDTGAPEGDPEAPAVVFGHGLLFSGLMFDAQVERLRDRYRCVTIDWRGQGRSPAATAGYDMDMLADDAAAICASLEAGPVHYVGLSMGGFIGQRLAARRPELVRSLTLLDTSAGPEDPDKVKQYRLLATIYRWLGIRPVRSKVEPLMFGSQFLADPSSKSARQQWLDVLNRVDRSGMRQAILGVTDREPVTDLLGSIAVPTLVVTGADDIATPPAKAQVIHEGIAGSQLEIVPDCGHSSTIEQPDALSDLIEAHVDAH